MNPYFDGTSPRLGTADSIRNFKTGRSAIKLDSAASLAAKELRRNRWLDAFASRGLV
jgi:hypothetical protein